jgi:cytochrome P450
MALPRLRPRRSASARSLRDFRLRSRPAAHPGPELVEESLRFDSPVRAAWRKTSNDLEFGGVSLCAGNRLYCVNGAANRDPAAFEQPDESCLGRADVRLHLTFGRATHHCIGASLSRIEGTAAFEALIRRLSTAHLVSADLRCQDNATLRIVKELRIEWDRD